MGSKADNPGPSTMERAKVMMTAKMSAASIRKSGEAAEERGTSTGVTGEQALARPEAPQGPGKTVIGHDGPPHAMTPTQRFRYRLEQWAQMEWN